MSQTLRAGALLALLAGTASGQTPTLEFLKPFFLEEAYDITPDGRFVSGGAAGSGAWIWDATTGVLSNLGAVGRPLGLTDDASAAAGTFDNGLAQFEGGVWTTGGGLQLVGNPFGPGCGVLFSTLQDLDADGDVAVGAGTISCSQSRAVRWTPGGGVVALSQAFPGSNSTAVTVSADGQRIGGFDSGTATSSGVLPRACLWTSPSTQEFLAVTPANPQGFGTVWDLNHDGSRACGEANAVAFVWQDGPGLTLLDTLPGLSGFYVARGLSDDGSVVVGSRQFGSDRDALLWTDATGVVRLVDWLAGQGLVVPANQLEIAHDVSADGRVICGTGDKGPWVLTLDDGGPWEDLGQGLAGTGAAPVLSGQGTLVGGSSTTLALTGARPLANTWLVTGFDPLGAPFKGGVLVPDVDILLGPVPTSAAGTLDLTAIWPTNLPSGFELWWQEWIADPAGPLGFAASNGLKSTTP